MFRSCVSRGDHCAKQCTREHHATTASSTTHILSLETIKTMAETSYTPTTTQTQQPTAARKMGKRTTSRHGGPHRPDSTRRRDLPAPGYRGSDRRQRDAPARRVPWASLWAAYSPLPVGSICWGSLTTGVIFVSFLFLVVVRQGGGAMARWRRCRCTYAEMLDVCVEVGSRDDRLLVASRDKP